MMRAVLDAAATQLNGQPASPWTARTNRAILANALEYAVELRILSSNPIKAVKWKGQKTTQEVDRRSVVNPAQARRLLAAVHAQMPSGPRLVAFFAVIYYAGLRPEEAVNLHKDNITLPPLVRNAATGQWEEPADNWGELRFCSAAPEVGAEWTDDGARREQRHLKSRPIGEWRRVPVAPPLTRILRTHLKTFGTGPGGRVFSGVHGDELASITYRRVWDKARHTVLTSSEHRRDCTVSPCPVAGPRRSPGASMTSGTLASPHGSTEVSPQPRSPSGPGTALPSCSKSTPSASTARTNSQAAHRRCAKRAQRVHGGPSTGLQRGGRLRLGT
jgi:integrase